MTERKVFAFCILTIIGILAMGLYLEYYEGIMPCPLCTLQRICFGICGFLFFGGILFYRRRLLNKLMCLLVTLFAATGAVLAARQIWIQAYPSGDTSDCGVQINYMLSVLPLKDVAYKIFSGTAECSQRGWELLGINIPEWSLIFFVIFMLAGGYYLIKKQPLH